MKSGFQVFVNVMAFVTVLGLFTLWQLDSKPTKIPEGSQASSSIIDRAPLYQEVADLLATHYDGEVDYDELYKGGLKGMANALNDPYTRVFPPVEAQSSREELSGEFGGMGVTTFPAGDGTQQVTSVMVGSPAEKAGVESGDIILSAYGKSLKGMDRNAAIRLLRGKVGSKLEIQIKRGEETLDLSLTREIVISPSVIGTKILEDGKTGYLQIREFTKHTFEQFKEAITQLNSDGMTRLVLDLRFNGGGSLRASTAIADSFFDQKDLLITTVGAMSEAKRKRIKEGGVSANDGGPQQYFTQDEEALVTVPCLVLVNGDTASASEVLAGALQDHGRAFILGSRSYGKGVVQIKMPLRTNPDYELKVTIGGYFTPLGNHLRRSSDGHSGGIEPDLKLKLNNRDYALCKAQLNMLGTRITEKTESIIDKALREAAEWEDVQLKAGLDVLNGVWVTTAQN